MDNLWGMGTAIFLGGAVFGLAMGYAILRIPLIFDAFWRSYGWKVLCCPVAGTEAEVAIDASRPVLTAGFGLPLFRVRNCSLWPVRKECGEACLMHISPVPVTDQGASRASQRA